ncbi:hypothetical protein OG288_44195 [Streptomyces tauricus]|uniref:Uncharacterized protein n=1 Tax=Streptomyces tauricus TaxID=68274 RepID=A0ABZ1JT05_9ACTN|nr:hypothetical protein [Streptomyces tauricus]
MLVTLLPGVREIRTPLAVGYTWLLALWLAIGHRIPESDQASGLVADIYRLAHAAGLVAVGIAVSVGAYIAGVIATQLGLGLTYVVGDAIRRTPVGAITPGHNREKRATDAIVYVVVTRLAERLSEDEAFRGKVIEQLIADPPLDSPAETSADWESLLIASLWDRHWAIRHTVEVENVAAQLRADHFGILWRLRGTSDPAALEHDRLQAEGDFRLAMFGPLAAVCIVTAIRLSPWFLLTFPLLIILIYVGVAARAEAEESLAAALGSGRVIDPALARLDAQSIPMKAQP